MADKRPMELEAGWSLMRVRLSTRSYPQSRSLAMSLTGKLYMQRGIEKLKKLLENEPEESFTAQEYMTLYT